MTFCLPPIAFHYEVQWESVTPHDHQKQKMAGKTVLELVKIQS
jgi:hypothetical protein